MWNVIGTGSTDDHAASPRSRRLPVMDNSTGAEPRPHRLDLVEAFLLSRCAGGCSARTLEVYGRNLRGFAKAVGPDISACGAEDAQRYLAGLGSRMKPVSVHQAYRTLRTFFGWCVGAGLLADTPMRGIKMKIPKTLPRVPEDEAVRRLLGACPDTFEGRRNRALVAFLADSGLRISEALRLRISDMDLVARTLTVRGGKGGKDGVGCFGRDTSRLLRTWLEMRPDALSRDHVFVDRQARPLSRNHGTHILHRLSTRAGLERKVGPHALRSYAATAILRKTGDLELVRRVLRHETLAMTLRYARLADAEVIAKFEKASPIDCLLAEK